MTSRTYASRGLEYCIKMVDGSLCCVIPSNLTEQRLMKSNYYASRKDVWLDDAQNNKEGSIQQATGKVDIALTMAEEATLQASLELHGDNVESHGWYEKTVVW